MGTVRLTVKLAAEEKGLESISEPVGGGVNLWSLYGEHL